MKKRIKLWGEKALNVASTFEKKTYRQDLQKQEGHGKVAHERLTELRVTIEWLLAKPWSFSNHPAF